MTTSGDGRRWEAVVVDGRRWPEGWCTCTGTLMDWVVWVVGEEDVQEFEYELLRGRHELCAMFLLGLILFQLGRQEGGKDMCKGEKKTRSSLSF